MKDETHFYGIFNGIAEIVRQIENLETDINSIDPRERSDVANRELKKLTDSQDRLNTELASRCKILNFFSSSILKVAYDLASTQRHPAVFYDEDGSQISFQIDPAPAKAASILQSIKRFRINKADAAKEINSLLDHVSAKRIIEEMDVATYNANTDRLFGRVASEFQELSDELGRAVRDIDAEPTTGNEQGDWNELHSALTAAGVDTAVDIAAFSREIEATPDSKWLSAIDDYVAARAAILTAGDFIERYRNFLSYAKTRAAFISADFSLEESSEKLKNVTAEHALRIEEDGILANKWPFLVAGGSALLLLLGSLYIGAGNSLLLHFCLYAALIVAGIVYAVSVSLGTRFRSNHIGAARNAFIKYLYSHLGGDKDSGYDRFRFPPINVNTSLASILPKFINRNRLSNYLVDIQDSSSYRRTMRLWNAFWMLAIPLAVISITFLPSLAVYFISQRSAGIFYKDSDRGICLLDNGHVIYSTDSSYFVAKGLGVSEIAKSSVLGTRLQGESPELDSCLKAPPAKGPVAIKIEGPLDLNPVSVSLAKPLDLGALNVNVTKPLDLNPVSVNLARPLELSPVSIDLTKPLDLNPVSVNVPSPLNVQMQGPVSIEPVKPVDIRITDPLAIESKEPLNVNVQNLSDAVSGSVSTSGPIELKVDPALTQVAVTLSDIVDKRLGDIANGLKDVQCAPPCSQGSAPMAAMPAIVPIIVETKSEPITIDVKAEAGTPTVVDGPSFVTQIHLGEAKVQNLDGNTVVLPLFVDPVTGTGGRFGGDDGLINNETEAFKFGLGDGNKNEFDPVVGSTGKRLVASIGAAFKACMDAKQIAASKNGTTVTPLKLRVEGYASADWKGKDPKGQELDKETLNLYLAEGRRRAVIRALGIDGERLIEIDRDSRQAPFELDDRSTFGFDTYADMSASLEKFVSPADAAKQPAEMMIFARSVVIRIPEGELRNCGA